MACDNDVEESPEVTNAENPRSPKTPQSLRPNPMSSSTETYRAWSAVMHDVATKHAETRAVTFIESLHEYAAIPESNRPVVSPFGVLVAEIIALLSILRAQNAVYAEQMALIDEPEAAEVFRDTEKQLEIAALAIKNINIH
jgi:hypothetical protein